MFAGKNIWITGGSSGLGLALARMLGERGASLGSSKIETMVCDVAYPRAVDECFKGLGRAIMDSRIKKFYQGPKKR